MSDEGLADVAAERGLRAGERLRAAREEKGLSLQQVAAETRIAQRHLESIEEGRFADLPGRTYAVGFSRTYSRLLGLDANEVVAEVRAELAALDAEDRPRPATFEPGDPARVPSRALGWISAAAAVLVLAGLYFAARAWFYPSAELPSLIGETPAEEAAPAAPADAPADAPAAQGGEVVFTALEDGIWVKFYDAAGRQLMQKQMARGERYTVPADAEGPQIWTGRPDAFSITVGGRPVARLSEEQRVVRDVPVSAQALLARPPAGEASPTG